MIGYARTAVLEFAKGKIFPVLPDRVKEMLRKEYRLHEKKRQLAEYSRWPAKGELIIVCKSMGSRCGIAQHSTYLAERLNASIVESPGLAQGEKDAVIINFEPRLYPSPKELRREVMMASKISKIVILDCHSVAPWLREFSHDTVICVKSLDVAATSGLQPVQIAGLVLPNLKLEPRPPPREIVIGCFGFALPWKNFHKVISLASRLDIRVKIVTSVCTATNELEELSSKYLTQLKAMSNSRVEIIEVFGNNSEIAKHLQLCSHLIFAEESDGTVSASMRFAALVGRPILAVNTRQAREEGVVLVGSLDQITPDLLRRSTRSPAMMRDGFEDYARVIGSSLLAPLYVRMGHYDQLYDDPRQKERIEWLRFNCAGRVVDVGCASGYVTSYIGAELGVEFRKDRAVYAALRYPHIRFRVLDARKEAVEGFDTVVFGDVVEHMSFEEARDMISLWSKKNPKLILVTTPNGEKTDFDPAILKTPEHEWMPTKDLVEKLVADRYDYTVTTSTDCDFWFLRMTATN
jgi:hypothetical protein